MQKLKWAGIHVVVAVVNPLMQSVQYIGHWIVEQRFKWEDKTKQREKKRKTEKIIMVLHYTCPAICIERTRNCHYRTVSNIHIVWVYDDSTVTIFL